MEQQISEIKRGERDYLFNPDPEFAHLVIDDRACATKVRGIHLSNDLWTSYDTIADARLSQLGNLPNVEEICLEKIFKGSNVFLKSLRGKESVRTVIMYASGATSEVIQYIAEMPNVEMLAIEPVVGDRVDLDPLMNHAKLRRLQLGYHSDPPYRGPVSVLATLLGWIALSLVFGAPLILIWLCKRVAKLTRPRP